MRHVLWLVLIHAPLIATFSGCAGEDTTPEQAHGACIRSNPGVIELCGEENAVGPRSHEYVDAMRQSCEEDGQTWLASCDPSGALGTCRAEQDVGGGTTTVTLIYVYPVENWFETPEDVKHLCENTGTDYVPL